MSDSYIHGFSPAEQRRLTRMQEILNQAELREFDLGGVRSILDVGAGLGQMTRALAAAAGPDTRVVGIERDPRQLREAERQAAEAGEAGRVEMRQGAAEDLPLADKEWGTFDLCHARFLLEHVPDPAAVVRQMVRAARPDGGRIVLVDDDHDLLRLWPECPEVDRAWQAYVEGYRDAGHDPLIGRRLAGLLYDAGAPAFRAAVVYYGTVHGNPMFGPVVDNLIEVLEGAAGPLDDRGRIPRAALGRAVAAFRAWREHPAATVWYALPLVEGRRV